MWTLSLWPGLSLVGDGAGRGPFLPGHSPAWAVWGRFPTGGWDAGGRAGPDALLPGEASDFTTALHLLWQSCAVK